MPWSWPGRRPRRCGSSTTAPATPAFSPARPGSTGWSASSLWSPTGSRSYWTSSTVGCTRNTRAAESGPTPATTRDGSSPPRPRCWPTPATPRTTWPRSWPPRSSTWPTWAPPDPHGPFLSAVEDPRGSAEDGGAPSTLAVSDHRPAVRGSPLHAHTGGRRGRTRPAPQGLDDLAIARHLGKDRKTIRYAVDGVTDVMPTRSL